MSDTTDTDATTTDAVEGTGGQPVPGTTDPVRLFQVSRQLDRLRDDCRWLLRRVPGAEGDALTDATDRYRRLCASLGELLDDGARAEMAADLGVDEVSSLPALMLATGQLAAWVDGLLLAPAYLASEQARAYNASLMKLASESGPSVPQAPRGRTELPGSQAYI